MPCEPLRGKTIAIPETRELDKLVRLLAEQGATPLPYPLVGIADAPDSGPIEAWIVELVEGRLDDVVIFTGEGVRKLAAAAERMGRLAAFVAALGRVRTITRGPKPAAAMHALGLRPTLPTRVPTSQGIIAELADEDLRGRRVGVQLYAENASQDLIAFLHEREATVLSVAPYAYVAGTDDHRVVELIDKLSSGAIDAVAFTSSAQVDRVFQVADERLSTATLLSALERVVVAAVGPTCAATLRKRGVHVTVVPERSFFMKTLVAELTRALAKESSTGSG